MSAVTATQDRGVPWPPEDALPRLRAYSMYRDVYRGEHKEVFCGKTSAYGFKAPKGYPYLPCNVSAALTDLLSWRLFGEGFTATVGDEAAVNGFIEHTIQTNHLRKLCLEGARRSSWGGDAFLKARYDARQERVVVNLVDPARVFPEWDEADAETLLACTIGTVLSGPMLWLERYEMREDGQVWITNRLFALDGDPGDYTYQPDKPVQLTGHRATAALLDEQATGLTRLPIVHVANNRQEDDPFGQSDYVGLMELQGDINDCMSGRSRVRNKLVRPIMYGPHPGEESLVNGQVDIDAMEFWPVNPGDGAPVGVVTWDASLSAVDSHIDDALQLWAAAAGVELTVVLPPQSGGPVSGRAIKLTQTRTQANVRGKQLYWEPVLSELLSVCTELAKLPGVKLAWQPEDGELRVVGPHEITIGFSDGLPADTTEEISEQVQRVEAGLQSRKRAIMLLDGVSAEDADAVIAQADAEQAGSLHLASSTPGLTPVLGGSPSFVNLTGGAAGGAAGETANP